MWAYARQSSAKQQMRLCYEDVTAATARWDNSDLAERFSEQKMYEKFVSLIHNESSEQISEIIL